MARRLILALALAPALCVAKHVSVPLTLHRGEDPGDAQTLHGVTRLRAAAAGTSRAFTIEPATLAKHDFWYGLFDVGDAKDLRLVLDTGSPFVELNPGLYKPSSQAVNQHSSGNLSYSGTMPDGCGTLTIFFQLYSDTVTSQSGITVTNQTLFKTLNRKSPAPGTETHLNPPFEGIVGLDGNNDKSLAGLTFFGTACSQKKVDECRFGIAFGTSGTGKAIFGGLDKSLDNGTLKYTSLDPFMSNTEWVVPGAVAFEGSIVEQNQSFTLDTGTPNVLGWLPQVQELFDKAGIQGVEQTVVGCGKVLFGYYPCDKPPQIGFTIGGTVFDIEPSAFPLKNNGNNNCTTTIVGAEDVGLEGANQWILGQAWMQGKYFDFDVTHNKVGAALLKDPVKAT